ncbi:MAG: C4-dicarboxylate ABC transporter permease [Nitratireductor sp.]|nr:C4-dicarboxylate ABC transporter permease [Nitratireductor sp.]
MINRIDSIVGGICDAFGLMAGMVIAFIALSVGAEVLVRNLGLPAFGWTLELCEYGLLVVSFLGAPWVLRRDEHISVDVLLRYASPASRRVLLTAADALALAVCALLAFYATQVAFDAYVKGSLLFKYLVVPQWIVLSILPAGMTLLAIEFALRIWRRFAVNADHLPGGSHG